MSWYKFGVYFGYLIRYSTFAYIFIDMAIKIYKLESFVTNIIALFVIFSYTLLAGIYRTLGAIAENTNVLAFATYKEIVRQQERDDLEKLLNDFGTSEWKLEEE